MVSMRGHLSDSITVFCKTLKQEVERVVRYKKREMEPLTNEEKEQYREARECYLVERPFKCQNL